MTTHPGKAEAQRRALDQIGCGNYAVTMAPKTRDALLKAGLIEQCGEKVICRDRFGVVTVPEYQMPAPVHMQWCQAMAEECEDEG